METDRFHEQEGFVKIEYDYVIGSAKLALQNGCKHFHLVSSQGVNENSSYLYMKTKVNHFVHLTKVFSMSVFLGSHGSGNQ